MAKAKKSTDQMQAENTAKFLASQAAEGTASAEATESTKNADGSTGDDIAGKAAKAEKEAAAALKKADAANKKAAKDEAAQVKKEARAAAKIERDARLAELGKNYKGSMLALADRVKAGAYVKGITGQLRSTNELAVALDGVTPNGVIQLAKHVLGLDENPYTHLNVGQQSMNLRNKMRGAISKKTLTIEAVKAAIVELDLDATAAIQASAKAKAEAKAKADAEKAAKATKVAEPVAEAAEAV